MILVPLPLVLACILGFFALQMALGRRAGGWLAALLGLLALQALINALALHYAIPAARAAQPVTAMAIPALTWLAWRMDGIGARLALRDSLHLIGPLAAALARVFSPALLDVLVPAAFAGYGAALGAALLRAGPDVPRAKLGQGVWPRLIWAGNALGLVLSASSDIVIAVLIAGGDLGAAARIVDLATTALLLGLGGLILMTQRATGSAGTDDAQPLAEPSEDHHAIFARLEDLMATRRPWRDPDITLAQLARRLHLPAKSVSAAVNLVTGDNISRYVNTHRIYAACTCLAKGASVTDAMLEAGFVTKSNFNREFNRIMGIAPSGWQSQTLRAHPAPPLAQSKPD